MGTIADLLNTAMRDFQRYSGDGLPNEPVGRPLPVGDPASGQFNPTKKQIREAFRGLADAADGLIDPAVEAAASADRAAENAAQAALDRAATTAALSSANLAKSGAESARDLSETYAGVTHRAAAWAALALINGLSGDVGYVGPEDTGTHTDPIATGTVPNEGVYTWADDGLGSAQAERTASTGLAVFQTQIDDKLSANIGALVKQAELDRAAGFKWSLADWYLEDTSRIPVHPWIDRTDKNNMFQDEAGTVPVTSLLDPVRLIKSKTGYAGHDQLIVNTGNPGIYKERGGVGYVEHGADVAYHSREDVTLSVPMFLATGVLQRELATVPLLSVINDRETYFALWGQGTGQNRPDFRSRGRYTNGGDDPAPGLKTTTGTFRDAPLNAPMVMHGGIRVGEQYVTVNDLATASVANAWDGGEEDTACRIGTGLNTKTAAYTAAVCNFDSYMDWIFFGEASEELRANVVEYIRLKIERPIAQIPRNILVLSDSTGDETNETAGVLISGGEWVYQWAQKFATDNPGVYTDIRGFSSGYNFRPPIVLQDGSGGLRIWNHAIAGSQPGEHLGTNYPNGIRDVPLCDTIVINHGYNPVAAGMPVGTYKAQMMGLIEAAKAAHPGAHLFLVRQPRSEGTTNMDAWVAAIDELAVLYGATVLDVWQRMQDFVGDKSTLYADGLHPSALGVSEIWMPAVNEDYAAALPLRKHGPGYLNRKAINLLENGSFLEWSAGLPVGFTKTGGGVVSEVLGADGEEYPVAVQITDTGTTQTILEVTYDPADMLGMDVRGQTVTLSTFMLITAELVASNRGRIEIEAVDPGGVDTQFVYTNGKWSDGWQWVHSQVDVPLDATHLNVALYGRFDGGPMTASYSRAVVTVGDKPRRAS